MGLVGYVCPGGAFGSHRCVSHQERTPHTRDAFRTRPVSAHSCIPVHSIDHSASLTISNLYGETLHDYFSRVRNVAAHLRNSSRPLNRILDELQKLERYLDEQGRETLAKIRDLVVAKDNLDFHYANQGALKVWLFVHVPATYGLVVLIVAHVAVVYAYSSGVP